MKYCDNCGSKLEENQKFCSKCGKSLIIDKNNEIKKSNIRFIFNILKVILYIASFILFFFVIALIVGKNNGECYEHYCENNLILFGSGFVASLVLAIICSLMASKYKNKN